MIVALDIKQRSQFLLSFSLDSKTQFKKTQNVCLDRLLLWEYKLRTGRRLITK